MLESISKALIVSFVFSVCTLHAETIKTTSPAHCISLRRTVTPQMFGAFCNGINDDTDAINQACKELNRRGGGTLYFPKGIYLISKFEIYAKDFGYGAIQMYSNIEFQGEDEAIIKVADDVNKEGFAWQSVFIGRYKEETTNNVFRNLVFELNGHNNLYPFYLNFKKNACCAAIRTGYPRNIKIEKCEFRHCPGCNCIALGYPDRAVIKDCVFKDNADVIAGNQIHDHSCILAAGYDLVICGNVFINKNLSSISTAIEVNSIGGVVRNNYVENFRVGCLVSPLGVTSAKQITIEENTFVNNRIAFQVWNQGENVEVDHIEFIKNTIQLTNLEIPDDYAIDIKTYVKRPVRSIKISGNKIVQSFFRSGSYYGGIILGGELSYVDIKDNDIQNLAGAAVVITDPIHNITVDNNQINNCCLSSNPDANRFILINSGRNGVSSNIIVKRNTIRKLNGSSSTRGIWIINESDNLIVSGNRFIGFEPYNEIDAALSTSKILIKK